MKKRGSLSLSVNAIVILVLALTMLGLGIAFMRGMFGQLETTIKEVTPDQLTNPPTRDNPITLSPSILDLRRTDKVTKVTLAFMNTLENNAYFRLTMKEGTGTPSGTWIKADTVNNAWLIREQISVWTIVIDPADTSGTADLHLMRFEIASVGQPTSYLATKDLPIKISS